MNANSVLVDSHLLMMLFTRLFIFNIHKEIMMTKKITFASVVESVWACIKTTSEKELFIRLPTKLRHCNHETIVGTVVIVFNFMPTKGSYNVPSKRSLF